MSRETKTVLGRVLHWNGHGQHWQCAIKPDCLLFVYKSDGASEFTAALAPNEDEPEFVRNWGPTEADAILALQSTLRKMAELEVAE